MASCVCVCGGGYHQHSLAQGWWCLALGQGTIDFGTISIASIKTLPFLARPEATSVHLLALLALDWGYTGDTQLFWEERS